MKTLFKIMTVGCCALILSSFLSGCDIKFDDIGLDLSSQPALIEKTENTEKAVAVEDAVNYTKEVIVTPEMAQTGWEPNGMQHKIAIPKITSETENAKAFNEKLYDVFGEYYEMLLNDQEKQLLLGCEYKYKIHNGIIGIVIESYIGPQGGGVNSNYTAFYYDSKQDKELTLDEYITTFGLTKEELWTKVQNTTTFSNAYSYAMGDNSISLKDCILDTSGTLVFLNDTNTMMGWNSLETEAVIK